MALAPCPVPAIRSLADFHAAVTWAVALAHASQARRMWWVDAEFANWPLESADVLQALTHWLQLPQRQLVLLAKTYDAIDGKRPRFAAWRQNWSHALATLAVGDEQAPGLPTLLVVDQQAYVQVLDKAYWRGRAAADAAAASAWAIEIDALAQRSSPDFPVTRLGL
jgi:hypothetical protein